MRALLVVSIYLTALLVASGGAAYVSLEVAERLTSREAESLDKGEGTSVFVAKQLRLMTWGMMAGALLFVGLQAIGHAVFHRRVEAEENPFLGLWIQLGAALFAVVIGGVFGAAIAG